MIDIRDVEAESIRAFVQQAADDGYLSGRVLDYGCGKQPYRSIVERTGAEYIGFDPAVSGLADDWRGVEEWDVILCTQVIQYAFWLSCDMYGSREAGWLYTFREELADGGTLVMTGPTNWPILEENDHWRFTPEGIKKQLMDAQFDIERLEERGRFSFGGDDRWCLGWGVVARA